MISHDLLINPIINEKTMLGMPRKVYTFEVAKKANKFEIRDAVEEIFGVQVDKVNMSNVRGRLKRKGKTSGYTPSWKKAIVTLKPSSKGIEFFEGIV